MSPAPLTLPDELVEEVILRLPPEEPAGLVRAALVCRRWCCLVSDPGFRRRFREFHRRPPLLGMLCNRFNYDDADFYPAWFVPTAAFPRRDSPGRRVLDARHGRVLFEKGRVLVVWDVITDEARKLPFPWEKMDLPFLYEKIVPWAAAVLCSAVGVCGHLDCCHHGPIRPFLVVYVCSQPDKTFIYTYSSDTAAWSEPAVCAQQPYIVNFWMGSVLVGNALYFGDQMKTTALKYDLNLHQVPLIPLPSLMSKALRKSLLTTTEDGGLALVNKDDSKLYMWSRKDTHEVDAKWERRVIELKTVLPVDVVVTKLDVIGSIVGIIFIRMGDEVYTIDLKTYKVKKVYKGGIHSIFPYMSFYTPVLRVATTGEGLSAGASTAEPT